MTVGDDGAGDELPGRSGPRRRLPSSEVLSRLVPTAPGGRRRVAEVGAVAGAVVVVLAFVGATVALRPSSAPTPDRGGPGLPAPAEVVGTGPRTAVPSGTSSTVPVPGRQDPSTAASWPGRTGSASPTPSGTPRSPAPDPTRAPAPGPTSTVPTRPTPTVSPTPSPTPSPTATETATATPSPTPTEEVPPAQN